MGCPHNDKRNLGFNECVQPGLHALRAVCFDCGDRVSPGLGDVVEALQDKQKQVHNVSELMGKIKSVLADGKVLKIFTEDGKVISFQHENHMGADGGMYPMATVRLNGLQIWDG